MKSATVEAAATKASAMETASALSEAELWRRDERNSNESYYKSSEKSGRIHFATS
jgi:Tfp pilus assembly protein PilV